MLQQKLSRRQFSNELEMCKDCDIPIINSLAYNINEIEPQAQHTIYEIY